ncbi:phosphotransferase [[Mycobacterium] zoologicum]|uniref:phosphotransferase n=1 Tax=[Mycobacterium] zoologicum TaxID=2872311 RepID=UPI001CDA8C9C|nr:phosphotransferase [Mycolicibacter sp. MYC101]MEB3061937.1 phosphotransferase [Mycolicibacter sp. MYC101]
MTVTFDQIKKNYAEEVELGRNRTLSSGDQLPLSYEEITPTWLTAVLTSSGSGAQVLSHRLGPPDAGTSSRRRIYLTWNKTGTEEGLPASVFCKGTMSLQSRYILGMNGGVAAEPVFYNSVRPTLDVRAPQPLFARYDPETLNSVTVMHDLGEEVTFCSHESEAFELTLQQARSQLRLLAKLHAKYLDGPELKSSLHEFNDWEDYFTITVEAAGFGPSCARGFTMAQDVIPPRLFARAHEIWPATLRSVEEHRKLPRTLIHSDVHLKNWYIDTDGEMGLTDWQCACKGNWGRDLAYALSTALTPDNRRAWERDLVAYYTEQLHAAGTPQVGFDTAWRLYRHNLFSALAWWTGTLGQPPEAPQMQLPAVSREFIRRMTTAIDDLDALDSFD